jgi:hypothetical protein
LHYPLTLQIKNKKVKLMTLKSPITEFTSVAKKETRAKQKTIKYDKSMTLKIIKINPSHDTKN